MIFIFIFMVITIGSGKGQKNCFFSYGPILREIMNLHRKCKKRISENIRHSQNWLSSDVYSSKCKKMSWGRDSLFPAQKMFFSQFIETIVIWYVTRCLHTKFGHSRVQIVWYTGRALLRDNQEEYRHLISIQWSFMASNASQSHFAMTEL